MELIIFEGNDLQGCPYMRFKAALNTYSGPRSGVLVATAQSQSAATSAELSVPWLRSSFPKVEPLAYSCRFIHSEGH